MSWGYAVLGPANFELKISTIDAINAKPSATSVANLIDRAAEQAQLRVVVDQVRKIERDARQADDERLHQCGPEEAEGGQNAGADVEAADVADQMLVVGPIQRNPGAAAARERVVEVGRESQGPDPDDDADNRQIT